MNLNQIYDSRLTEEIIRFFKQLIHKGQEKLGKKKNRDGDFKPLQQHKIAINI